jgi:hypothetical protein
MPHPHVSIGIALLAITIVILGIGYRRAPKRAPLPWWGWTGLLTIIVSELLLFLRAPWVTTFFTPLVWTSYVFLADGLNESLGAKSFVRHSRREFLSLAFWSIPLWLIFEGYNLRLENWTYVGLPANPIVRGVGYAWSFATIWPAIFETAALVRALGGSSKKWNPRRPLSNPSLGAIILGGLVLVALPLLVPPKFGSYLFGAVWVGFIFLLDPINARRGRFSFLGCFERGDTSIIYSYLAAGWICGILWEFWNYWAGAKWLYIFPMLQGWKIFEMPVVGFLGFLPFALECRVMFEFVRSFQRRILNLQPAPEKQSPKIGGYINARS